MLQVWKQRTEACLIFCKKRKKLVWLPIFLCAAPNVDKNEYGFISNEMMWSFLIAEKWSVHLELHVSPIHSSILWVFLGNWRPICNRQNHVFWTMFFSSSFIFRSMYVLNLVFKWCRWWLLKPICYRQKHTVLMSDGYLLSMLFRVMFSTLWE